MFENFTRAQVRTWSMLGSRGTYGAVLAEYAKENPAVVALSADLGKSSGLDRFRAAFPERFINTGIAEQGMLGIAAGLAAKGFVSFASTFASFAALRAGEQVHHYMGYMGENVKLVGLMGGLASGTFGVTHQGLDDIAALRSIPGLTILCPADGVETMKATIAAAQHSGPVYLRLGGTMNLPVVHKEDYPYQIGKSITLRQGSSVAIVATGTMVHHALKAAELLAEEGIEAEVVDMHTVKPLDTELLDGLKQKVLLTVEEHSVTGGLGAAVAEHFAARENAPKHVILGIPQGYPKPGEYGWMLEQCGLGAEGIAAAVRQGI